jgi:Asp-tRNA(Asn)/Glu-tRNA(Gln) amidotransferase A subunit family amidase
MCNGIYGLKPSVGRLPYGGQQSGQLEAISRLGLQAVAGPIANSVSDIDVVMSAIQSCSPWERPGAEDVLPWTWSPPSPALNNLNAKPYLIGILASDGLVEPLPPIQHLLSSLATTLRDVPNVSVVNIPTPPAWSACQSIANSLMALDGENTMLDILESNDEPLIPWLKGRMRRGKPKTLEQVRLLQVKRTELERQMNLIWTTHDGRRIDTIICPIAPHPVPPLDRWNAVNYTSSFVLLDWPTGVVTIRNFHESDLKLDWEGGEPKVIGSWDKKNRELWDEKALGPDGRKIYLGTALGVQVLGRRGDERGCWEGMSVVDAAVKKQWGTSRRARL